MPFAASVPYTCVNYTSSVAKATALLGGDAVINNGNTAWMLAASAFVMIMTPAVGFFYAGLAGEESASNTILMSFITQAIVSLQWFFFGYSFAFGPGNGGFGSFQWAALNDVGYAPSGAYGFGIPHVLFCVFQVMFAQITPALISGAVIGRMKFKTYCVFVFIWTTLIYDALAHWMWSFQIDPVLFTATQQGWLNSLGAIDFAGGTVIHMSSGFAALAAALVLGKRRDNTPPKPHDQPMVVLGATLLWFGWFGFNPGSEGGADAVASYAFINTHLATCAASLSWLICDRIGTGGWTATGASIGAVAGLVAITPASGYVLPWAACVIGAVVSPICYLAVMFKNKIGFDDTLDSWAVHGVGGAVGAFCTGLFACPIVSGQSGAFYGNPQKLGWQCLAIFIAATYSFFGTVIILLGLKVTMGLRISEEEEALGIDVSEHGGRAYNKGDGGVTQEVNPVMVREMANAPHLSMDKNDKFSTVNPHYSHGKEV